MFMFGTNSYNFLTLNFEIFPQFNALDERYNKW